MSVPATCYDWPELTAHRRRPQAEEPAVWRQALAHLDDCPACRRAALAADPTLLFQRLATPERADRNSDIDERSEVEAALQAVSALRAARRVEGRRSGVRRVSGWARWAAAAGLALLALSLETQGPGAAFAPDGAAPSLVSRLPRPPRQPITAAAAGQAGARIYHLDGDDLSVVMIVDESLDV